MQFGSPIKTRLLSVLSLIVVAAMVLSGCSGTQDLGELDVDKVKEAAGEAIASAKEAVGDGQENLVDDAVNIVKDFAADPQKAIDESILNVSQEERDEMAKNAIAEARKLLDEAQNDVNNLTDEQREELKTQATTILESGVDALRTSITTVLEDQTKSEQGVVRTIRVGVNSLGGYAATSSYIWLYALRTGGFEVERVVGTGLELTDKINNGEIDITFEALPQFVDGEVLGTWAEDSEFPMRIQGRKGFGATFPVLTQALKSYGLSTQQIDSLVPNVHTRGVAPEGSQDAAVETWLLANPEVITQLR